MVKNLTINKNTNRIKKTVIHKLTALLIKEFNLKISSLFINFVSASQILKINKEYLNHHYSTDIITFDYSENDELDSEIYISVDNAEENAKRFGVTFDKEIIRLVIHGILHLCGYSDKSPSEKKKMKQIEDKLYIKYYQILYSQKGKE